MLLWDKVAIHGRTTTSQPLSMAVVGAVARSSGRVVRPIPFHSLLLEVAVERRTQQVVEMVDLAWLRLPVHAELAMVVQVLAVVTETVVRSQATEAVTTELAEVVGYLTGSVDSMPIHVVVAILATLLVVLLERVELATVGSVVAALVTTKEEVVVDTVAEVVDTTDMEEAEAVAVTLQVTLVSSSQGELPQGFQVGLKLNWLPTSTTVKCQRLARVGEAADRDLPPLHVATTLLLTETSMKLDQCEAVFKLCKSMLMLQGSTPLL